MVKTLHKKLLRELWRQKAQVFTIALVVASGIAGEVSMRSTYASLLSSKRQFDERSRFADIFAKVQHAPDAVLERIRSLPHVSFVEGRVTGVARLQIPGFSQTVRGQMVSLPENALINTLTLKKGRLPKASDEVVLSELFAAAHRLSPGSHFWAFLNGRKTKLRIVGIGVSPEYVWVVHDFTQMGDDRRFGVVWMKERYLVSAFHQEGGVNDISLTLDDTRHEEALISRVERVLAPYGVLSVVGRSRQPSNQLVEQELKQLKTSAHFAPLLFLGVAAFLLNVMLSRMVESQREHLATLKALGFRNSVLAVHVMGFAIAVVLIGALFGTAVGIWGGHVFIDLYQQYFHFPKLTFRLENTSVGFSVAWSFGTGLLGAFRAAYTVFRLAPAEALKAEAPAVYRPTLFERMGWQAFLPLWVRMVFREVERHPVRTSLSALGVALATAVLVMGNMGRDAVEHIFALQFEKAQKEDVTVSFTEALPMPAVQSLARLPGVFQAEYRRAVPVRLTGPLAERQTQLWAMKTDNGLQQLMDVDGKRLRLPKEGVILSSVLADILGVREGENVEVEVLEGRRQRFSLAVATRIDDTLGLQAYVHEDSLKRKTATPRLATMVALRVDSMQHVELIEKIDGFPKVLGVSSKKSTRDALKKNLAESFLTMQVVLMAFAITLAVGVVYNNARMALSQRSRDLATLRILGFGQKDISLLLLGEQALVWLVGIPLGLPLGKALGRGLLSLTAAEVFRMPVVVSQRTWGLAVLVVAVSGLASAALVIRRAHRLDLLSVLKARD